jgi:prevent-host-death family protein
MTKSRTTKVAKIRRRARVRRPGRWLLQDAKARFGELVRRVYAQGPQHVTVHGRDEVVVVAAEELRRLKGDPTGEDLIAAMRASRIATPISSRCAIRGMPTVGRAQSLYCAVSLAKRRNKTIAPYGVSPNSPICAMSPAQSAGNNPAPTSR